MNSIRFDNITESLIRENLINLHQLVFEVTDACNLRCKYCGYSELYEGYDVRKNEELSFNKAIRIIDYLNVLWKKHFPEGYKKPMFISFYGGEPLLNMALIRRIISYLEGLVDCKREYIFSMTTNALLLDKYMDYIVDKKIVLLISLDGNKDGHSYRVDSRGINSFDKVYANICKLKNNYSEYFESYVNFNAVLHDRNSLEITHRFIKDNFQKDPQISQMNNSGIRAGQCDTFDKMYKSKYQSLNEASNKEELEDDMFITSPNISKLINYIYQYSDNIYNDYNELLFDKNKSNKTPTGTCSPFSKKMFITVNGKILQCEKINHEFAMGQIFENEVKLDLKEVAAKFNEYVFKLQGDCSLCYLNKNCSQCIFQIDSINEKMPQCNNFLDQQRINTYLDSNVKYLREHPDLYEQILKNVIIH